MPEQNITPSEALKLLDLATSHLTANRQDHINIQTALKVIAEFIEKHDKPKLDEKP